jgi:hypothetical protein
MFVSGSTTSFEEERKLMEHTERIKKPIFSVSSVVKFLATTE